MLASFPQAPANVFTEDELKHIFLYAHPPMRVDRYENAGLTALSQDMNEIKCYMERQAAKEALTPQQTAKGRGNGNGNTNGNSSNSNPRSRGCNQGHGNGNNGNTSGRGGNRNSNPPRGGNQPRTQASDP